MMINSSIGGIHNRLMPMHPRPMPERPSSTMQITDMYLDGGGGGGGIGEGQSLESLISKKLLHRKSQKA